MRDADTFLEIIHAQARLVSKATGLDLNKASPVERLAIEQAMIAQTICGMRTIEVWPDEYRRIYYQAYRDTHDVLGAQRTLEAALQRDLAAGTIKKTDFFAWGARIEGISRSCERQSIPPLLNELGEKLGSR